MSYDGNFYDGQISLKIAPIGARVEITTRGALGGERCTVVDYCQVPIDSGVRSMAYVLMPDHPVTIVDKVTKHTTYLYHVVVSPENVQRVQ